MRKKLDYDYCSASPILEWLGDKWALVVLLKLHENEVIRFNELYKTIPPYIGKDAIYCFAVIGNGRIGK